MTATVELDILSTQAGRMKWSRMALGVDATEMAGLMGLERASIRRWETGGNVKRKDLLAWASIVGVPVEWLEEGGELTFKAPDQQERRSRCTGDVLAGRLKVA